MKVSVFVIFLFALIVGGCTSIETVKEAQGQGVVRIYQYAYDDVFDAAVFVANNVDPKWGSFDVVEVEKTIGRILINQFIYERIAVFVKVVSPNVTEVEIVSKPVLPTMIFRNDWAQILFERIDAELQAKK